MGNCLVMEKKVIKIVRNDGKVLEYTEPVCVHHILTQFSGHSLSYNNTHLLPDAKLVSGRLYYLLPITMNKKKTKIKKVTFASPEVEDDERSPREDDESIESNSKSNNDGDDNKEVSVVRMKIVVHKQELEKLLQGGSVHEMMYETLEKKLLLTDDDLECNSRGWRPLLDSIPESESLRRI